MTGTRFKQATVGILALSSTIVVGASTGINPDDFHVDELRALIIEIGDPSEFDDVFEKIAEVPRIRDEFETTEQFETRQREALDGLPEHFLIGVPVDIEYVKYDADRQELRIATYAIENVGALGVEYSAMFGWNTELHNAGIKVEYGPFYNIVFSLPRERELVGTYTTTNAFGQEITIEKIEGVERGIFERAGQDGETVWFEERPDLASGERPVAFQIEVVPEEARVMKAAGFTAAVLVKPKAPFYATGVEKFRPTNRARIDRTTELRYMIADILGIAIYDAEGELVDVRLTQ